MPPRLPDMPFRLPDMPITHDGVEFSAVRAAIVEEAVLLRRTYVIDALLRVNYGSRSRPRGIPIP